MSRSWKIRQRRRAGNEARSKASSWGLEQRQFKILHHSTLPIRTRARATTDAIIMMILVCSIISTMTIISVCFCDVDLLIDWFVFELNPRLRPPHSGKVLLGRIETITLSCVVFCSSNRRPYGERDCSWSSQKSQLYKPNTRRLTIY